MTPEIKRLRDKLIAECDKEGLSFAIMVQDKDGFEVSYDVDRIVVSWSYRNKWEAMVAALKAAMAEDEAENATDV